MSTAVDRMYPEGAKAFQRKEINVTVDTLKVALVASTYIFDVAHTSYADISTEVIDTPITLTTVAIDAAGYVTADNVEWASVTSASDVGAFVIYLDTGTASTSTLLLHLGADAAFPITADGRPIQLNFTDAGRVWLIDTAPAA